MQNNETPIKSFFLFINAGSGGNLGKQMLQDEVQKYEFRLPIHNEKDIQRIDVYVYNLRENREQGFKRLKQANEKKLSTTAVVCGGDGTIMWVVSQFKKYGIDPAVTPIAIIPLGTGNDFSRALGWGGSPFLKWSMKQMKQLIREWMQAQQSDFDLWDVTIDIYEEGRFEKVNDSKDFIMEEQQLKKTFCNYFSFGIDGQIGYSFDKLRTKNKFANFAVYGAVGAFNELQKPMAITEFVDCLHETEKPFDQQFSKKKGNLIFQTGDKKIYLYGSKGLQNAINESQKNILALNIDSYTGGTTGIWKNAKSSTSSHENKQVSFSDSSLEIVSFDSGLAIAMQKSIGGFAKKIVQSKGPLRYDFKRMKDPNHCTYLQIDGQFIRVYHPKSVILQKSQFVKGGKIRVLRRNGKKSIFNPFKDLQQLFS